MTSDGRASRRQVFAFIALADAPMPQDVRFHDGQRSTVSLDLDSIADLRAWLAVFGEPDVEVREQPYPKVEPISSLANASIDWRGLRVWLAACDAYPPLAELDEATRGELAAVAAGGEVR